MEHQYKNMQDDKKKNSQQVESSEDKSKIEPLKTEDNVQGKEQDQSDEEGYVVVESGLGIDE